MKGSVKKMRVLEDVMRKLIRKVRRLAKRLMGLFRKMNSFTGKKRLSDFA